MKRQPKTPLKIAVALVNFGFIAAALAFPGNTTLMWLAVAVWVTHGSMALAALFLAPMKGASRLWALQVLVVGTVSLIHLLRLEPNSSQ